MSDSNKKQRGGLISNAFGMAKKLSTTGLNVLNHVAPGTVSKLTDHTDTEQVIPGYAKEKSAFERKKYDNPQQMMREHIPNVTGKLLGKHYKKINNVASFISPDLNNQLSDYLFDKLNDFVSELSSVDALLKEVGAKDLAELAKDPERSKRISAALANQNKVIAALQGAITGATGGVGAIIDVPTSLALALRSIYHTGRAYGFELNSNDQEVVAYIFKQIDLGTVAEKQALLAAIRAFVAVMQTHNVSQLQQLLGSSNDIDVLKKWIANEDGSFKFSWMNNLPQFGALRHLTPVLSVGVSAVYSWKLVDDATDHANIVFAGARQYLQQHPDEKIDVLEAYERTVQLISEASPILLNDVVGSHQNTQLDPSQIDHAPLENETITQVEVKAKQPETENKTSIEENIQQGIQTLADTHVDAAVIQSTESEQPVAQTPQKKPQTSSENQKTASSEQKESPVAKTVTKKRTSTKAKVTAQKTEKTPQESSDKSGNDAE